MSCFKKKFITFNFIFILFLNSAFAQDPETIIAAKVNDHIISAKDVLITLERLPKEIKEQPLPKIYPDIVNELINQYLIAQRAYKDKFDQNKVVLSQIEKSKESIMAKYWLKNYIDSQLTENNIKKVYKNYLKSFKSTKEYNASHILVKEKNDAKDIIKKLNRKINFSELANKFSIGPSGKDGGELGWFSSGKMVPEFEKATINLNVGEFTQNPVKTQFGFHIIKLNGSRVSKPKKQNQIETSIKKMIKRKALKSLEKELKKDQKIIINKFEDVAKKVNR